jgi:predicted DNA-binding protein
MTTLSPEVERLAKLVGAHTGKTAEEVLREAVEAQARIVGVDDPERRRPSAAIDLERVREITRRVTALPLIDARAPRDIRDEAWSRG